MCDNRRYWRIFIMFAAVVVGLTMTGCSTFMRMGSNSADVLIRSEPQQADIVITDEYGVTVFTGKTPVMARLKTGGAYFDYYDYKVRFVKDGYQCRTAALDSILDEYYCNNILIGGVPGMLIIDPLTGCMWNLPREMFIKLDEIKENGKAEKKIN